MSGGAFPTIAQNAGASATTATTGSFTPVAKSRLIVFGLTARNGNATVDDPNITSSGLALTSLGAGAHTSNNTAPDLAIKPYISTDSGATPSAQTLTNTVTNATVVGVSAINVFTDEITGNVLQTVTAEDLANGDPSITWGSLPNWYSHCIVAQFHGGGNSITDVGGYVFINQTAIVTARLSYVGRDTVQTPLGPSQFTSTNVRALLLAIELEADLTAPASPAVVGLNSAAAATVTQTNRNPPASVPSRLIVIARANRSGSLTLPSKPTISSAVATGTNLTWTEIVDRHTSNNTTQDLWTVVWISNDTGSSPPTGVDITVSATSASGISINVHAVPSSTTDGTIRQTATGEDLANGDPSCTLGSAPLSTTLVMADAFMAGSNNPTVSSSGWRTQRASSAQSGSRFITMYSKKGEGASTVQATSTNTRSVIVAFELNPASTTASRTFTWDGSAGVTLPDTAITDRTFTWGGTSSTTFNVAGGTTGIDNLNDATDAAPSGWTPRWVTTGVAWTERVGGFIRADVGTTGRHVLANDLIDGATANIEVMARVRRTYADTNSMAQCGVVVRGHAVGGENGYVAFLNDDAGTEQLRLNRYQNGTSTPIGTGTNGTGIHNISLAAGVWYNIRLRANSTTIQAKVWEDGTTEPGSWQITATDSTHGAAGYNGLFAFGAVTAGTELYDGNNEFDFFSWGFDGATAPGPTAEITTVVEDDYENAAVSETLSTVSGATALSPTVNLAMRDTGSVVEADAAIGWWFWDARIDNVLNKTPLIRINLESGSLPISGLARGWDSVPPDQTGPTWEYRGWFSYDYVNWFRLDETEPYTAVSTNQYVLMSHFAAFTQNTVYLAFGPHLRPSQVVDKISAIASNALVSKWDGTDASVIGDLLLATTTAITDPEDGTRSIPALPIHGFKISNSAETNVDSPFKKTVLLTSGVHPSEQEAQFSLWGAVDFLLSGHAATEALFERYDFWVIPCVNPAGVYAGYWRQDPHSTGIDSNRIWNADTTECAVLLRPFIKQLDRVHVGFDFHCLARNAHSGFFPSSMFPGGSGDIGGAWETALVSAFTAMGEASDYDHVDYELVDTAELPAGVTPPGALEGWVRERLGAVLGTSVENGPWWKTDQADWGKYGQACMRALTTMYTGTGTWLNTGEGRDLFNDTGGVPGGWTARWLTTNITWAESGGTVTSTKSVSGAVPGAISFDTLNATADAEILVKAKASYQATDGLGACIIMRGTGSTGGTEAGYRFSLRNNAGTIQAQIAEITAGTPGNLVNTGTSLTWATGDWWWLRARVQGTALKFRVWEDGDPEPDGWTLETTDATLTSGWHGLLHQNQEQTVNYDYFAYATKRARAPMPAAVAAGEATFTIPGVSSTTFNVSEIHNRSFTWNGLAGIVTPDTGVTPRSFAIPGTSQATFNATVVTDRSFSWGGTSQATFNTTATIIARSFTWNGLADTLVLDTGVAPRSFTWAGTSSFTMDVAGAGITGLDTFHDEIGALPNGWTIRWVTTGVYWGSNEGLLRAFVPPWPGEGRHSVSFDEAGDAQNPEAMAAIRMPSLEMKTSNDTAWTGVVMRGSGGWGTENGYVCYGYRNSGGTRQLRIVRYNAGVSTVLATVTAGYTWTNNATFRIRFQSWLDGSNNVVLKARIWAHGSAEPGTWDIDYTDSSASKITTPGWVGFMAYQVATHYVDFFSFGTEMLPAPEPVSADGKAFFTIRGRSNFDPRKYKRMDFGAYYFQASEANFSRMHRFTGVPPPIAFDFVSFDNRGQIASTADAIANYWRKWNLAFPDYKVKLYISVPTATRELVSSGGLRDDELANTTTADSIFVSVANSLINNGFPDAVVRIGWEANGGWFPWGNNWEEGGYSPDTTSFKGAFQKVVNLFRAQAGANFKFGWSMALGFNKAAAKDYYPGDAYVDIIMPDVYGQGYDSRNVTPDEMWERDTWGYDDDPAHPGRTPTDGSAGHQAWHLQWHVREAIRGGKELGLGETGIGWAPDNHGFGDCRWWWQKIAETLTAYGPAVPIMGVFDQNPGDYHSQFTEAENYTGTTPPNWYQEKDNVAWAFRECFGENVLPELSLANTETNPPTGMGYNLQADYGSGTTVNLPLGTPAGVQIGRITVATGERVWTQDAGESDGQSTTGGFETQVIRTARGFIGRLPEDGGLLITRDNNYANALHTGAKIRFAAINSLGGIKLDLNVNVTKVTTAGAATGIDFFGAANGLRPVGWTPRWGNNTSWIDSSAAPGFCRSNTFTGSERIALASVGIGAVADIDISTSYRCNVIAAAGVGYSLGGLVVRGDGYQGAETGYALVLHQDASAGERFGFRKYVNGVLTDNVAWVIPYNFDANTLYRMRLNISGTTPTVLRAKVWLDGAAEPSSWMIDTTDASSPITAAGWAGPFTFYYAGSATSHDFDWVSWNTTGASSVPSDGVTDFTWDAISTATFNATEIHARSFAWGGTATAAFQTPSAVTEPRSFAWGGTATTSFQVPAITQRTFTWGGTSNTVFNRATIQTRTFNWGGTSTTAFDTVSTQARSFTWAGTTDLPFISIGIQDRSFTWAGQAGVIFARTAVTPRSFLWGGTSTVSLQVPTTAARSITIPGTAGVTFRSSAIQHRSFNWGGTSDAIFVVPGPNKRSNIGFTPEPIPKPAIPVPRQDVESLVATVTALKEAVEILQGQRGVGLRHESVRWQDLVEQGLVDMNLLVEKGGGNNPNRRRR